MKFTVIDGDVSACGSSPLAKRMIAMLDALPDGQLVTIRLIAKRLRVPLQQIVGTCAMASVTPYRLRLSFRRIFFGNRKTVAAGRRKFLSRSAE